MTLPDLISFSGYSSAGKDTAADVLVKRARFVKTHMKEPIEQALAIVDPWIVDQKEGTLERFSDLYANLPTREFYDIIEVRRLVRMMEMSIDQAHGQNLWTELVFKKIKSFREIGNKVALSGVDHQRELDLVRENEGVCVWINRPIKSRGSTSTITAEDCDVVVTNDGTPKDLYVKIVVAVEEFISNKETPDNVG